jgi:cell division transport system ATP-binding protein
MVEFINVVKKFDEKTILNGLSFRIVPNTMNQIVGEQSSGKSTILKMIYGAIKPDEGYIRAFDADVSNLKYSGIILLRRYLGLIFEDIRLIKGLTVRENISTIIKMTKRDLYFSEDIFDILSIGHLLDKYPRELSISEQSLVNIVRGVIFNFPLVLADEPFRYLSYEYKKKAIELFKHLNKQKGITFLIASQNVLDDDFNVIFIGSDE